MCLNFSLLFQISYGVKALEIFSLEAVRNSTLHRAIAKYITISENVYIKKKKLFYIQIYIYLCNCLTKKLQSCIGSCLTAAKSPTKADNELQLNFPKRFIQLLAQFYTRTQLYIAPIFIYIFHAVCFLLFSCCDLKIATKLTLVDERQTQPNAADSNVHIYIHTCTHFAQQNFELCNDWWAQLQSAQGGCRLENARSGLSIS